MQFNLQMHPFFKRACHQIQPNDSKMTIAMEPFKTNQKRKRKVIN